MFFTKLHSAALSKNKRVVQIGHVHNRFYLFLFFRWWKWPAATSPTSSVSPASSRQTRACTSAASSTSAATWRSTTASTPTSRWSQRGARGRTTLNCGSRGGRHTGATRNPIAKQRAGSWRGDQPAAAALTVMRAACSRVGGLPCRSACSWLILKEGRSPTHTPVTTESRRQTFLDPLCFTVCSSVFIIAVERARCYLQNMRLCSFSRCIVCLRAFLFALVLM